MILEQTVAPRNIASRHAEPLLRLGRQIDCMTDERPCSVKTWGSHVRSNLQHRIPADAFVRELPAQLAEAPRVYLAGPLAQVTPEVVASISSVATSRPLRP
jgi:hypothetical protein